jgi:hypothetical protein
MVTLIKVAFPLLFYCKMAPSFLAQLRLEIPLFTSQKSIDAKRFEASLNHQEPYQNHR